MPEQRRDPTTGAWCVVSEERGGRPIAYLLPGAPPVPAERCPFCPGHEHHTTATLGTVDGPDGWLARAFANKYPAVRVEGEPWSRSAGPYDVRDGVGAHEVVVESPEHDRPLYEQPGQTARALRLARARMNDLHRDVRLAHLTWLRNRGALAGASQPHPHAQILGSTAVPPLLDAMARRCTEHAARTGRALLDDVRAWEEEQQVRMLGRWGDVVAFCPFAPRFAFEVWVMPVHGGPTFRAATDQQLDEVGAALEAVGRALAGVLDRPARNVVLFEAPREREAGFRWHLRMAPRLVATAALEALTGMTVLHTPPEEAAAVLRDAMAASSG